MNISELSKDPSQMQIKQTGIAARLIRVHSEEEKYAMTIPAQLQMSITD